MDKYGGAIQSIIRHLIISDFIFLLYGLIVIVVVVLGVKKRFFSKRAILWAVVVLVIGFSYPIYEGCSFYLDIKNEDYITYYGEFEFQYVLSNTGNNVKLVDQNQMIVSDWHHDLESQNYYGTVVYTKRTKYVLCIELDNS